MNRGTPPATLSRGAFRRRFRPEPLTIAARIQATTGCATHPGRASRSMSRTWTSRRSPILGMTKALWYDPAGDVARRPGRAQGAATAHRQAWRSRRYSLCSASARRNPGAWHQGPLRRRQGAKTGTVEHPTERRNADAFLSPRTQTGKCSVEGRRRRCFPRLKEWPEARFEPAQIGGAGLVMPDPWFGVIPRIRPWFSHTAFPPPPRAACRRCGRESGARISLPCSPRSTCR